LSHLKRFRSDAADRTGAPLQAIIASGVGRSFGKRFLQPVPYLTLCWFTGRGSPVIRLRAAIGVSHERRNQTAGGVSGENCTSRRQRRL